MNLTRSLDPDYVLNEDVNSNTIEDNEQEEGLTWQPSNKMHNLSTKIFKNNLLPSDERKSILQTHTCNKHINFKPPAMDRGLWKYMPRNSRENDKQFAKISYRTSAALSLDLWKALEQSLLDTRALILNSLSFTNEIRCNEAIKYISPTYQPAYEQEKVFGPTELRDTLEKENAKNKMEPLSQYKEQFLQHKTEHKPDSKLTFLLQTLGLQSHISNWIQLFGESLITEIIKQGYSPTWSSILPRIIQPISHHQYDQSIMSEIKDLIKKNIIKPISIMLLCFTSQIFSVLKKNGKNHLVLDLRHFNQYLIYYHFKMEDIETVKPLIFPDYFMASLNIKDAFLHVLIKEQDQTFFAFDFFEKHYTFTTLPFGLSTSPLIFTNILCSVIKHLRTSGIRIVAYLDDLLIVGNTKLKTIKHLDTIINLLTLLGFAINWKKSKLIPSKSIKFFGFTICSSKMTISLPHHNVKEVIRKCKLTLVKPTIHIRKLASLIGKLITTTNAIFPA
ncbi:15905_t:CDS:2 [Cetraspora pellucida]|uniref:15905_t:CDS:1 n=1 Tax=Cetraspora pellucida TaxID=1433469 RepID=A0A9N9CM69_9GLOM|nr:15905_t:CDS:2 [Cetraspora pellucida]